MGGEGCFPWSQRSRLLVASKCRFKAPAQRLHFSDLEVMQTFYIPSVSTHKKCALLSVETCFLTSVPVCQSGIFKWKQVKISSYHSVTLSLYALHLCLGISDVLDLLWNVPSRSCVWCSAAGKQTCIISPKESLQSCKSLDGEQPSYWAEFNTNCPFPLVPIWLDLTRFWSFFMTTEHHLISVGLLYQLTVPWCHLQATRMPKQRGTSRRWYTGCSVYGFLSDSRTTVVFFMTPFPLVLIFMWEKLLWFIE